MLSLYNVGIKLKEAKSTEHYTNLCSAALLPLLFSLSSPLHLSTLVFFFHPLFSSLFSPFSSSLPPSSLLSSFPLAPPPSCSPPPFSSLLSSSPTSSSSQPSSASYSLTSYSRTPQSPRVTTTVTKAARNSPTVTEPTSIPVPVARTALSGTKRLRSVSLEKLPASLTAKRPSRTPTQDTTPVEQPPTLRTGGNEGTCTFTARVRACNSNRSL